MSSETLTKCCKGLWLNKAEVKSLNLNLIVLVCMCYIVILQTMRIVRFMLLNLYASSDKRSTCASLKPIPKNRYDDIKFTFDVTKCDRILDELVKLGKIKFSHTIPSMDELKRRAYCKLHNIFLMLPMIAMFFVDKYNRP